MSFVLKINDRFLNRRVRFFNEVSLNLAHDKIASDFDFKFMFDPDNRDHKELTTPLHYHEAQIFFNDELLLTGFVLNHEFTQSAKPHLTTFQGYSLPGVLEDCEIPTELYPLQSDGLSLTQIATKFANHFRLKIEIDEAVKLKMDRSFKTSTASETSTVKEYLTSLAKQKNIIISHNAKGNLLFTEAKTEVDPILRFDLTKGAPDGMSFKHNVNGQGMHKFITLQKQVDKEGGNAGKERVRNPLVVGSIIRESVKSQTSGDDNETVSAAARALSNEIAKVKLTITMPRWVVGGKIIKPNNIIEIIAPKLYLYHKTRFFIESVNLTGDETSEMATLNCVLPEVYSNKTPINPFEGINIHPLPVE